MFHLIIGISITLFGLIIGGVGIASAGVGIGIPMLPLGLYLTYRGWRIYKYEQEQKEAEIINPEPLIPLERTKLGKTAIGIILILVGIGTSASLIGIPILFAGLWFIYDAFKLEILKIRHRSQSR